MGLSNREVHFIFFEFTPLGATLSYFREVRLAPNQLALPNLLTQSTNRCLSLIALSRF